MNSNLCHKCNERNADCHISYGMYLSWKEYYNTMIKEKRKYKDNYNYTGGFSFEWYFRSRMHSK